MNPVEFQCIQHIARSANDICDMIADTSLWSNFQGAGVLPGIAHAEYELRTEDMVGSRIAVKNSDGSRHVEVIDRWDKGHKVAMRFVDFSPPLSKLATHFTEEWTFESVPGGVNVTRKFALFPKGRGARIALAIIARPLKQAVANHLHAMAKVL